MSMMKMKTMMIILIGMAIKNIAQIFVKPVG